ncbi:COF family HAD hydrolase protein [Mycoplasmopsis californica]|uniref:Cof-type HAD-IIB family hydrolase n=1 Tax=Mycoplasmopsis equigenitalium TaxID=114883 RepID=A0ABY5J1N8_9BACT|nr:HAD family hydrolase [Mycoplasmopsis equigenitalium]UUD37160.1 Cof-type HAD-IIB family hydrolase [Mycoplasmopsis equigenitalium]VEU69534.1 COF family HAD hydrolase protein [Mycoplasmopsis californica]
MDITKILDDSKIIFLDLDGTLFDARKTLISTKNALFLDQVGKDKEIAISTSRGFDYKVYRIMKEYNINKLILYNGAKIYNRFSLIRTNYIDVKVLNLLFRYLIKRKIVFVVFNEQIANIYLYNKLQVALCSFVKGVNPNYADSITVNNNTFKISLILKTPFFTPGLVKRLRLMFPSLDVFSSSANYVVEITSKDCNKGKAGLQVCEMLNIEPKKAIHIGDSMTDATCINQLGTVIAMGNASREFKKLATYVGPKHSNGGLYKLFNSK